MIRPAVLLAAALTVLALHGPTVADESVGDPRANATLADPTRPPARLAAPDPAPLERPERETRAPEGDALGDMRVTMIRLSGELSSARINGQNVRPGDTLGPGRVLRIEPRGVIIDTPDGQRTLSLTPHGDMDIRRRDP